MPGKPRRVHKELAPLLARIKGTLRPFQLSRQSCIIPFIVHGIGFADSSGHGVGRLLVGLVETRLCSRGSQPLHHRGAPALSRPRCSCVHLSRYAVGRLNPSFGGQPPLDRQKCGFCSLLCWVSFPSFSHLYSRGTPLYTPSLALLSFMFLGKLWNSCTLQT